MRARNFVPVTIAAVIFHSSQSWAILDFIGQTAKDTAKAAAYSSAVAGLLTELNPSTEVQNASASLNDRIRRLNEEAGDVVWASSELKSLSEDTTNRDWSGRALDENIQFTSRYISRIKRLLVQMGLAGTDVATAMNTAETNTALNEVLKNQQAQILLEREARVGEREKEAANRREWEAFITAERQRLKAQ